MPSSSTPAAWTTAPSGCSAGIEASSSASASRSATSQAAIVDLGAELVELGRSSGAPARFGAAAADQQQVAGAVALDEVAGDEGAEAAGAAGDQHRALGVDRRRRCPSSAWPTRARRGASDRPLAQGELRLLGAERERRGQRRLEASRAVDVDQDEAAGVLGLGGADQAPDRGGGQVGRLALAGGDRALGDERQARVGRTSSASQAWIARRTRAAVASRARLGASRRSASGPQRSVGSLERLGRPASGS